ncbi:MAG: DNA polymerase III subunit delta' [Polyangiaceae bacterium]|nr:DNA polymerase III subunit delta' [Polyangiaceae bacterium]
MPGLLETVRAQDVAVGTLTRSLEGGRLHHAYRFEGPAGVGKELAALGLAQALVCERPTPRACGACRACRLAVTFSEQEPHVPLHPDVLFVQRGLYAPSLLGTSSQEKTGIGVEQIRKIVLTRVGFPPHEGRALVVIVRDADDLTVSAANALLKTLEEPPARTHFVLLTSRPGRLLDTLRSRTLAVRFGLLPEPALEALLAERGHPPELAARAEGSVERALALVGAAEVEERDGFAAALSAAAEAPDLALALERLDDPGDRGETLARLAHVAETLARTAREAIAHDVDAAARAARQHACVLAAAALAERNVQPRLVLESLLIRLRRC